jgi:hypothetical protein
LILGVNVSPNENLNNVASNSFATPEDEIKYLRAKIEEKEKSMLNMPRTVERSEHANSAVEDYKEEIKGNEIPNNKIVEFQNILAKLGTKQDDKQVLELATVMLDHGVAFAIQIAQKVGKPELEDDFHRFLVMYLLSGHEDEAKDIPKREWKALNFKLYEIVPPPFDEKDEKHEPKYYISLMEQLYATLQSVANDPNNKGNDYYSLELAISNGSNEVVFYVAVPHHVSAILDKTLQGYFPGIEVIEHKSDYCDWVPFEIFVSSKWKHSILPKTCC